MKAEGYSFNEVYVKSITRARFLKEFGKVYPHLDLDAIYDQIAGKRKSS